MKISEFAKKTGVSADTLRYYEKIGLLPKVPRQTNGLRNYPDQYIKRIKLIQELKSCGMSLEFIISYLNFAKSEQDTYTKQKNLIIMTRYSLLKKIISLKNMLHKNNRHLMHFNSKLSSITTKTLSVDYNEQL